MRQVNVGLRFFAAQKNLTRPTWLLPGYFVRFHVGWVGISLQPTLHFYLPLNFDKIRF